MKQQPIVCQRAETQLRDFREKIYSSFAGAADAAMDLLDALSSNEQSRSPVELSLNELFRRGHGSVYQAIGDSYGQTKTKQAQVLALQRRAIETIVPWPLQRNHFLLVVDVTAMPRPDGQTVSDCGYIYTSKGRVEVGHEYSVLGLIPEGSEGTSWIMPLSIERVPTDQNKEQFGLNQALQWLADKNSPLYNQLCLLVADRAYPTRACLHLVWPQSHLVTVARLRNNLVVYHSPQPQEKKGAGRPRWYGDPFRLNQPDSWSTPTATLSFEQANPHGKLERIEVKAWSDMLLRGQRKPEVRPFHQYPFTLLQVITYRPDGRLKYKHPLWLTVFGQRRNDISLQAAVQDYFERTNMEHFNRFVKQRLLLTDFQTSDTQQEENWAHLVGLAYLQLYLAEPLCRTLPRPWEKHLLPFKQNDLPATPTMVQRDFARIIRQIGTPAKPPKPRGNSPGRPKGSTKPPRPKQPVIKKGKSPPK
jgi:hypothetical protein